MLKTRRAYEFPQSFLSIKLSIKPPGVRGYSFNSTFPSTTTVFAWSKILRGYRPPSISLRRCEYRNEKTTHLLLPQNESSEVGQPFLGGCREVRVKGPRTRSVSHAPAYLQLAEKISHDFTAILKDILPINLGRAVRKTLKTWPVETYFDINILKVALRIKDSLEFH